MVYSDNAIKEVNDFFNSKKAYLDTKGNLLFSCGTDTVNYVLHNLTGP